MTGSAAAAVVVFALTNIGLGWYGGFRLLTSYGLFWLLCLFVILTSTRIMRRAFPAEGRADAILINYNWHDAGRFPIEAAWARSEPAAFTLLYGNPQAKVFAVHIP